MARIFYMDEPEMFSVMIMLIKSLIQNTWKSKEALPMNPVDFQPGPVLLTKGTVTSEYCGSTIGLKMSKELSWQISHLL